MRVKMTFAVLALAALALSVPASSAAAVIHVDPGESIQAAIDEAKPGTTIKLGEGVYKDSVNISKNDIEIVGKGRSKTKIEVPAAGDLPAGTGCTDDSGGTPVVNGICVSPEPPDDPKARCENSPPSGPDETIVKAIDDVEVSRLAVTGFTGIGVLYFCADDPEVTRVYTKGAEHPEYGIAAFASEDVEFTRNLTTESGEAGIYIGDSPHADATVWKNVAWNNGFGIFIRDAAHGTLQRNKTFGNCLGILFLNTDEAGAPPEFQGPPIDVKDWLAKQNNATANNRACPGGDEGGPVSGVGIGVSSAIDVSLIDNGVFGNDSKEESDFKGGILVVGEPGFKPSTGTKVGFNTAFGNTTDIIWDGQGAGNAFFHNDCLTSDPDGLCEDPDDNGDHGDDGGNGDDNDHGDDHPKGGDHHKGAGDHKKHGKKHKKKHHKKHKSKKHHKNDQ
jgi:hypothetical protein